MARSGVTTAQASKLSAAEIKAIVTEAFALLASLAGLVVVLLGELDRRQSWRDDGAGSLIDWVMATAGLSSSSARSYGRVAERICDLPHLADGLSSGRISFDKVNAVLAIATPENDQEMASVAKELSVPDLVAWAKSRTVPTRSSDEAEHQGRWLRCNDSLRTITAQLPALSYAAVKKELEERAKQISSEGETPWDQRMADALISLVGARDTNGDSTKGTLVVHVPFEIFSDPESTLPGELEDLGLISADVARRIVCGGEIIVALDDALGHTLYEGRAKRLATPTQRREVRRRDRHCRFPGCQRRLFTNTHHIDEWKDGGQTDIDNLVLLCEHHHHLVHTKVWSTSGDPNGELRFVGPGGTMMVSRPSPLWAQVTDPVLLARRRAFGRDDAASEDHSGSFDVDRTDPVPHGRTANDGSGRPTDRGGGVHTQPGTSSRQSRARQGGKVKRGRTASEDDTDSDELRSEEEGRKPSSRNCPGG